MTVKNYVLDINKTSLQHPSIVLRQDDYNIYTVNISVTENGTPVDLGSYTLNFLGITPAGAKIVDSKNFITNSGDLKNGKFSYRFPKEAAGSKGVYDVAYFRLKTTSGATSTIDLNLRVLGGIDLTADDVTDYITVDDTLRNTLVAEVFKKVDAKVDQHLATVKKGDKGDTGEYQTNLLLNSDFYYDLQGWDTTNNTSGANAPYSSVINQEVNARLVGFNTTVYTDRRYSRLQQTVNLVSNSLGTANIAIQWQAFANKLTTYAHLYMTFFTGFDGTGDIVVISDAGNSLSKIGDNYAMWDWADNTSPRWAIKQGTTTIPRNAKSVQVSFESVEGNVLYVANPMLALGSSISTYTSGGYYPIDTLKNTPKLNGNNMYVGDNTYMGTNTFMDGVSLSGKNKVNKLTDTDWLDIPLAAGRTGLAKYKVSLGKVFIHLDSIKGLTAASNNAQGQIGTLPVNPSPYYTRHVALSNGNKLMGIMIAPNGAIYVAYTMGNTMSENDSYFLDTVLM